MAKATKTDYARKCQQLDVLIDLLERENKRLNGLITRCKECKDWDTDWNSAIFPNCHYCPVMDKFMKPDDFCSYGERKDNDGT